MSSKCWAERPASIWRIQHSLQTRTGSPGGVMTMASPQPGQRDRWDAAVASQEPRGGDMSV